MSGNTSKKSFKKRKFSCKKNNGDLSSVTFMDLDGICVESQKRLKRYSYQNKQINEGKVKNKLELLSFRNISSLPNHKSHMNGFRRSSDDFTNFEINSNSKIIPNSNKQKEIENNLLIGLFNPNKLSSVSDKALSSLLSPNPNIGLSTAGNGLLPATNSMLFETSQTNHPYNTSNEINTSYNKKRLELINQTRNGLQISHNPFEDLLNLSNPLLPEKRIISDFQTQISKEINYTTKIPRTPEINENSEEENNLCSSSLINESPCALQGDIFDLSSEYPQIERLKAQNESFEMENKKNSDGEDYTVSSEGQSKQVKNYKNQFILQAKSQSNGTDKLSIFDSESDTDSRREDKIKTVIGVNEKAERDLSYPGQVDSCDVVVASTRMESPSDRELTDNDGREWLDFLFN